MSGGISNFAYTPPRAGPAGGTLSVRLPEISVGGPAPDPGPGGGGALPGNGSYGDPIQGFGQINRQMAETQRAFSATLNASNTINAGFEAADTARNAAQRAQLGAGFEAAQAGRAAMFAAPPVTGPMLPPNFSETAQVPATPTFDLAGPVPPPAPAATPSPDTADAPAASPAPATAPAISPATDIGLAAAGLAAAPADGVSLGAMAGKAAEAAGMAARTVGGAILRGGGLAGAFIGLGTGSIPSEADEAAMRAQTEARLRAAGARPGAIEPATGTPPMEAAAPALPGAFDPRPLAERPSLLARPELPAGFALPPANPTPLTPTEPDMAAQPLPGLTPAPALPGLEGVTPAAPSVAGPLPGLTAAPPVPPVPGLTPPVAMPPLPALEAADPTFSGPQGLANRAVTREQSLIDVRAEAARQGVTILTDADPEVKRYMDDAARREGVAPDAMHGLTIGDLIFVRESKKNDVRVLREELIHTEQQKGVAVGIGIDSRTSFEIDARKILLENAERWFLTPEEQQEISQEIREIERKGAY